MMLERKGGGKREKEGKTDLLFPLTYAFIG